MSSTTISLIVFACIFGGALCGIFLHSVLPERHLSNHSKDIVKLGMGLVATMAALVLGLLVASAKGSYDAQSSELIEMSANIALLDRVLAHYRGSDEGSARSAARLRCPRARSDVVKRQYKRCAKGVCHLPGAKFSTTSYRDSRQRTTHNARFKARRRVSRWISEKRAG